MAIGEESALSTSTLQELSAGLAAAAAAAAERLLPSGADKEMRKLSESVQQIAALVKDAKAKQWKELEDIVSDIIGILQLFSPRIARVAIDQIPQDRRANPKTVLELKDIRARLDKILKKPHFASIQPGTEPRFTAMAIGQSPVETLILSGKNDSKDQGEIIELLLSVKETGQAGPCVIPIDRKGGMTQLARAIIDDERVAKHFSRRIWVDASEIIDPVKLSRLISKPASTMFWVHKTLSIHSAEEQLLMVLDDIKNKNKNVEQKRRWIKADRRINCIRANSTENRRRIVLSPDHDKNPCFEHSLSRRMERLLAQDSWNLFENHTWVLKSKNSRDIRERPQLEAIGRNIVKKLEGSPPMIEGTGGILGWSHDPSYWKLILESQVWKLPVDEEFSQPALAMACYPPISAWGSSWCYTLPTRKTSSV